MALAKKGLQRPSIERMREVLIADGDTGKLYWAPRLPSSFNAHVGRGAERAAQWAADAYNGRFAGREAFTAHTQGYRVGAIDGKNLRAHSVLWAIIHGEWPEPCLDHINGIRDDNHLCNLRIADGKMNGRNHGKKKNNTSGHTGVLWCKLTSKWLAHIKVDGKYINLGRYEDKRDAIAAREASKSQYGFSDQHGLRPAYQEA